MYLFSKHECVWQKRQDIAHGIPKQRGHYREEWNGQCSAQGDRKDERSTYWESIRVIIIHLKEPLWPG